jgi:hypothetical protein
MENPKGSQDPKDGINICIGGKTISLKEFLKGEDEKEKTSEIEKEVKKSTRETKKIISHYRKTKWENCPKGVISTKIYSQEEVAKMAEERQKNALRQILEFYFKDKEQWFTTSQLYKAIGGHYPSVTALNSRIYKILNATKHPPTMLRRANSANVYEYHIVFDDQTVEDAVGTFRSLNIILSRKERLERKSNTEIIPKIGKKTKPFRDPPIAITISDESAKENLQSELTKEVDHTSKIEKDPQFTELTAEPCQVPAIPEHIKIDVTIKVLFGFLKEQLCPKEK